MHELTKKVFCRDGEFFLEKDLDRIIRQYLTERAKEIRKKVWDDPDCIEPTLGLSSPEADMITGSGCSTTYKPKDSTVGEEWTSHNTDKRWCSCVILGADLDNWKYCPECGTPRPKPRSLAELLKENFGDGVIVGDAWKRIADYCEKHFKEKK